MPVSSNRFRRLALLLALLLMVAGIGQASHSHVKGTAECAVCFAAQSPAMSAPPTLLAGAVTVETAVAVRRFEAPPMGSEGASFIRPPPSIL